MDRQTSRWWGIRIGAVTVGVALINLLLWIATSPATALTAGKLSGVVAVDATHAWAVGSSPNGPLILKLDGASWKEVTVQGVSGGELDGADATDSTHAWAVGMSCGYPLILHLRGAS